MRRSPPVVRRRARLAHARRRGFLPAIQALEERQMLVAGAFLQGTVFNDLNADGRPGPGEPYLPTANVALYSSDGSALIAQATADANGYFRFDDADVPGGNLQPGSYRVVETPPAGYQPGSARAITQLGAATVLSPTVIQATVIDPTNLTLTFNATYTGQSVTVQANGNPEGTYAGGLGLTLSRSGTAIANLVTNCIDLFHNVGGGDTFAVLPRPTASGFPVHGGRIAYLFNHYGMDPDTPAVQAAGLQIALWELENDTTVDLTSGVFAANGVDPAVLAAATAMLTESAGKNEAGVYLDATLGGQPVPQGGRQGMMAGGSYNFGNTHPTTVSTSALSGKVYVDVNDDGRVGATEPGIGKVTVVLSGVLDGGVVVTATTTTARNGDYRFEHLQPGTYSLAETPPVGYIDAKDTLGNRGGSVGRKQFTGITLGQGVEAVGYNFGHERPPQFTTNPILEVPLGATYVYAAGATDPDGDALHFTLASGLTGSQLNGDTGRLQWTPTAADLGGHDVTLRVADGRGGTAEQHYTLTVVTNVPNRPPVFTSDPVVDANVATPYTYQATAFDPDFDALTFAIVAGPAGMAIADPAKGLITWTPTADQLGRQDVVVSVNDGHGHTTFQPYAVLVLPAAGNHPPVIVSTPTTLYRFPAWVPGSQIVGTATVRDFPSDHRNPDFEQGVATTVVNDLVDKQLGLLQVDGGGPLVNVPEVVDDNGMGSSYGNQDPFRDDLSFTTSGSDWTSDWSGYNGSQQRASGQPGADTATWKVVNLASGAFEVRATWAASTDLAADATYRVYDGATLLATVAVNQSVAPTGPTFGNAPFQSLGTFHVAGGTLRVVLSAPSGGTIAADAVRVAPAANLGWSALTAPASGAAGSTFAMTRTYAVATPASPADFVIAYYVSTDATLGNGDDHLLGSETISTAPGKAAGVHAGTSPVLRLPASGGTYHLFAVVDGGNAVVESDETDNAAEVAQAISVSGPVLPAPMIVDNNDPGFTQAGYGWSSESGSYSNGGYNFSVLTAPAGTGSNTAQWQTTGLPVGDYLVQATWTNAAGRATNAAYQIYDGATLIRTVVVDQTKAPLGPKFGQVDYGMGSSYGGALFQALAAVHVTGGTLRVVLTDAANGTVVADAVRVQTSGPVDLNWTGGGVSGPLAATPGSTFVVRREYNIDGIAAPADFTIAYYASPNGVLGDGDDLLLGSEVITDAAGKAVGLHTGTSPVLRLPSGGGPVYVFAVLDAGAGVTESDEADNVGFTRERRPTYAGPKPNAIAGGAIRGVTSFNQWYRDTPGINQTIDIPLVLTETTPGSGTYAVTHDPFFPIDGQLFGNDIPGYPQHNFNFTAEFHGSFTYHGGEVLTTASDDDNWVFINNRLVIDAGGTHVPSGGTADLDALNQGQYGSAPLGLIVGQAYPIDIFYAERQTGYALFQVQTDIQLVPDRPYTYPVRAIDPDGDPVTYALLQAPAGMTIDAKTGLIFWQPARDQIGSHTISVQAGDGRGGFSEPQTYVLVVQNPAGNATPVFHPPLSPTRVHLGDTYTYQPNATDADGDPLTFALATHPDGMTIDRYTGAITWKPLPTDINGDFLVTIQASDSHGGTGTYQFHLTVDRVGNTDPVFDPPAPGLTAAVGQLYTYQAHAHDAEVDPLTFDLPVHPDGMIVVPDTGQILWLPTGDEVGPQDVILRVRDGLGGVALRTFQVTVSPPDLPPGITSTPVYRSQAGRTYTYQVRAEDPDAGDTLTFHLADPHPAGMDINPGTGLLTWPGAVAGTYHIDLSVDDGRGGVGTQGYDLQVVDQTNGKPEINSSYRPTIQLGRTYRYQVAAIDPDGDPLTYGLTAEPTNGPLPAGLAISPTGLVTWTPTADQLLARPITSFHVTADDQRGGTDDQLVTVRLVEQGANGDPTITSPASKNAVAGRAYVYPVRGSDPDGDPLAWSLDVHPDGMVIDPVTGVLAWAPTVDQIGPHAVTIRVADGQGGFATQPYTVTVRGEDLPPRFVPPLPTAATEHASYAFQLHATDPEGEALTYALAPIPGATYPAGLAVSPSGLLIWTDPTPLGPLDVAVRVEDEAGNVVIQGFTLLVVAPATNHAPGFTSDPARAAAVGVTYHYTLAASDPDGDSPLGFTLQPGSYPSGMTLVGSLITWTPTAATPAGAPTMVTVVVTDPGGAQGFQTFPVTVIDDHAPTLAPIDDATRAVGQPFRYDAQATDPDPGDTLTYLLTGPAWLHVDAAGRITGTPALGDRGTGTFQLVATDAYGKSSPTRTFHVTVGDDVTAPAVQLALFDNPSDLGRSVTILVTAGDDVGVAGLYLTVGGRPVTLDGHGAAIVTPDQATDYAVVATATDAAGHSAQATDTLHVIQPNAPALTATLHLLRDPFDPDPNHRDHPFGQAGGPPVVTAPIDVVGTAADPQGQPVSYTLAYAPLDGPTYTTIRTGSSAVADGVLGRFDPTMLANGAYTLRLTVHRPGVADAVDERVVSVEGSLKLGNLHLSFVDLAIPVAGIPITITRSYDTLNAGKDGDFGYGWTLDEGDFHLQVSQPDGSLRPVGLHEGFRQGTRVVITRPGMDPEAFIFNPRPIPYGYTTSPYYQPWFDPAPGTTSRLSVSPAELQLFGDEFLNVDAELTPYNPADPVANTSHSYTLTTRDKTAYTFDAETGQLANVSDRHGNTLYYDDWGITSDTGRKVTFERDPITHRITAITDPRNHSVVYGYDGAGNLISVTDRMNDPATTFVYRTDRPHDLDRVVDPFGRPAVTASYGSDGRLSGLADALGNGPTIGYDLNNLSATATGPLTNPATVSFDTLGNPIRQVGPDGSVTLRQFSGHDLVAETQVIGQVDDPSNGEHDDLTTRYTHDAFGAVLTQTDPQGHTTRFTYGPDGLPSTSTDAAGNTTAYGFDVQGNLTTFTSPTGVTTTSTYGARGDLRSVSTPDGTTAYDYNGYGDVTQVTDARGNVTTSTYDANGNANGSHRVWTDPNDPTHTVNVDVVNHYDNADRLYQVDGPEGTTRTIYDDAGRPYQTIDNLGGTTTTVYDAAGRVIRTTGPDGMVSATVYDAAGRAVWSDDPHLPGHAADGTHTVYDAAGRVIATERRANLVLTVATPANAPASSTPTDPGTVISISAMVYDDAGRVVWSDSPHAPGQPAAGFHTVYDAAGRVSATERFIGTVITITNPDSHPTITLTPGTLYSSTSTTADAAGRVGTSTDALGHVTRYDHDGDGHVIRTVFHDGSSATATYDTNGRRTSETDPLGHETDYQYDDFGALAAVLLPSVPDPRTNGQSARPTYRYGYDAVGHLTSVRDPLSQQNPNGTWTRETTFAYDALGRQVEHTLPLGQSETWAYNALGQLVSHIDFLGQKATYDYDALGRAWHKKLYAKPDPMQWPPDPSPAPAKTVAYAYDQYGAGGDRHDTVTIGSVVTDSAYDREGRLIAIASPEGTIHYDYAPATGQKTRVWTGTDPAAPTTDLRYGYDPFGRLTSVHVARLDGAAMALTTTYAYDAADRLTATTRPNGTTEARTYDDLNRLKSITTALTNNPGQILAGFTYTLDAAGRRTRVVENTGRQVDYTYDALGRLTGEAVTGDPAGDRTLTYTYDLASNRVTLHDSTASQMQQDTAYGYDDNDRMTSVSSGYNWSQRGYDANGALTSVSGAESATYAYDLEGRLVHAVAGGHSVDYAYDDAGRRTSQTVDGQTTTYLNDPNQAYDQVLEEYAPGMMRAATYVRGLDLLFQDRQGARSYYVVDGLGSTRALADANGSVTDTYTYDAYGNLIGQTGDQTTNEFLFAGYQRDAATGLDYLRARYYDAAAGRFTARDTYDGRTAEPITLNHYVYAGADPVDRLDPSGHDFTLTGAMTTGAIIGGVTGLVAGGAYGAYKNGTIFSLNSLKYALVGAAGGAAAGALLGAGVYYVTAGAAAQGSVGRMALSGFRKLISKIAQEPGHTLTYNTVVRGYVVGFLAGVFDPDQVVTLASAATTVISLANDMNVRGLMWNREVLKLLFGGKTGRDSAQYLYRMFLWDKGQSTTMVSLAFLYGFTMGHLTGANVRLIIDELRR